MTDNLRILQRTLLSGVIPPLFFLLLTYSFIDNLSETSVFLGSVPAFVTCYATSSDNFCDWRISYYALPSIVVILMPYIWYLLKKKELNLLYWAAFTYSLVCGLLGALAVVGKSA